MTHTDDMKGRTRIKDLCPILHKLALRRIKEDPPLSFYNCPLYRDVPVEDRFLDNAFQWEDTPEGVTFWDYVNSREFDDLKKSKILKLDL